MVTTILRRRHCRGLLAAVLLAALLSGPACRVARSESRPTVKRTRIRVSGSGTALPLLRILAEDQPDESLEIAFLPGLHTGPGVSGVLQGSLDLGAISRELSDEERSKGLRVVWLSRDGMLLGAHPSVGRAGVRGLTTEQVRDIYAGKITDWSEVGAKSSLPIVVMDRHEDESSKIMLRRYVLGDDLKITEDALALYYEPDMVEAVRATPGAIGYFSLGYAISQDVDVTRLSLDGVQPDLDSIKSGKYRFVRPLGFVVRKDMKPAVEKFVTWTQGEHARSLMTFKGYAPYSR